MTRFHGNQQVDPGIYFNLTELSFESVEERTALPGNPEAVWRRVPLLVLFAAAPIIGLVYLVFLPLVGILMLAAAALMPAWRLVREAAAASVRVLRPAWQPARAFLVRGRPARRATADDWAREAREELEAEGQESEAK